MSHPLPLTQANLPRLPDAVQRPAYDRSALQPGIVHVGVGGFHRSHEAVHTDDLIGRTGDTRWGICGVGLREGDRRIAGVLARQSFLYTLITKFPDGRVEDRVVGSLVGFLLGPDDPEAVLARVADEETKIVSLTITEGGYPLDPATGAFDPEAPGVADNLAHPGRPGTTFGVLAEALRRRRDAGLGGFTVLSCDNVQHNGDAARAALLGHAGEVDAGLAAWIEGAVTCPNAMVDRITAVTTPEDVAALERRSGVRDAWPVVCEPFRQWIVEDRFAAGRPAWEQVGARSVNDVTPYEDMKLRLLNAGHSVLGLLGAVHGHETIGDCVADPLFAAFLRRFLDAEATPVLAPVEGIDLDAYKGSLLERFGNPAIRDDLSRICGESSAKIPKFLLPRVRANLDRGGDADLAALVLAAWCWICDRGTDRHGHLLDVADARSAALHAAASDTRSDPLSFLRFEPVFGDLAQRPAFTAGYAEAVTRLHADPDVARQMQALLFGRA